MTALPCILIRGLIGDDSIGDVQQSVGALAALIWIKLSLRRDT